jgi:hypothetical protein
LSGTEFVAVSAVVTLAARIPGRDAVGDPGDRRGGDNGAGRPVAGHLTPFVNDTSPIPAGNARLIVRHTAAAPAVDLRANGKVAFAGPTNPNQAAAVQPAGTVKAGVVLAGTSTVAIGPANLTLKEEGADTIMYAIGSAQQKTLALVVQTIPGMGSAPGGVPAGTGGYAGPHAPGVPAGIWALCPGSARCSRSPPASPRSIPVPRSASPPSRLPAPAQPVRSPRPRHRPRHHPADHGPPPECPRYRSG